MPRVNLSQYVVQIMEQIIYVYILSQICLHYYIIHKYTMRRYYILFTNFNFNWYVTF